MMQNYETLEISIGQKNDQGYPINVIHSPSGEAKTISPLNLDDPELQEALDALEMDETDPNSLIEFGEYLFNAIFHADVLTCYQKSLSTVSAQGKALRLLLRLEPTELTTIPWEYLYDSRKCQFLATNQKTALVRYLPMGISPRPIECMSPLRLLVVISNPVDLVQIGMEQEKQLIEEALADRLQAGQVELRFIDEATISNINKTMREFDPHIFHFVGHSEFQDDVANVILVDDMGRAMPITDRIFKTFFTASRETRLVIFNSCQGAILSYSQRFIGLVPHLFHNKLPAIVAMQYPITNEASLTFVRAFYSELARSGSIEAAVSQARTLIYQVTNGQGREWGTPVLYLRSKNGQLIEWGPGNPVDGPVDDTVKREFVVVLLECLTMRDRTTRDQVVGQLTIVRGRVIRNPIDRIDVHNIVDRVLDFSGGLVQLCEILRFYEGDSVHMQRVDEFCAQHWKSR